MVDHAEQGGERNAAVEVRRGAGEDVLDETLEVLARAPHTAPLRPALDRVALLLEDEHVVAVAHDLGHPDPDEDTELLVRWPVLGDDLARAFQERVYELVADRDEQLLLAGEVVVDAARGQPDLRRKLAHGGTTRPP